MVVFEISPVREVKRVTRAVKSEETEEVETVETPKQLKAAAGPRQKPPKGKDFYKTAVSLSSTGVQAALIGLPKGD